MTITKVISFDTTKILINGIVHLSFKHNRVIAFQTWKAIGIYTIEITFDSGCVVVTEYNDPGKWQEVIAIIDEPNEA